MGAASRKLPRFLARWRTAVRGRRQLRVCRRWDFVCWPNDSDSVREQASPLAKKVQRICHDALLWLVSLSLGL